MSTTKLLINEILNSYYKLINDECLVRELDLVCDDDNYNLYELTHTNRLINEEHENLLNNFAQNVINTYSYKRLLLSHIGREPASAGRQFGYRLRDYRGRGWLIAKRHCT